jgi:hypothetical protein
MAELTCGEGGSTGAEVMAQINTNTTSIEDGLAIQGGFHYIATTDNLDLPETYTEVASLDVTQLPTGTYLLGISATYTMDTTQKSVFARFTINGGVAEEFIKENKDITDRDAFTYMFPYVHTGDSNFDLALEFRKEDATGTLDVLFSNVWLDRKL